MECVAANPFPRILVAVDGSTPARAATAHAIRLAQATGARLIFCHAVETDGAYREAEATGRDVSHLIDARKRDGHDIMDAACDEAHALGLEADLALVEGNAVDGILDAVNARAVNLVIVGTHGRHGIERWTLGSVAERLVRDAHCPVLTVHAEDA
jgi:nucleotide-binding universal stress UspA family protein